MSSSGTNYESDDNIYIQSTQAIRSIDGFFAEHVEN